MPALTSLNSFARIHRQRDDKLKNYAQYPHFDFQPMSLDLWVELLARNRYHLFAGNAEARITFAEILWKQIGLFDIAGRSPHCWVTVSPAQFAFPIHEAHRFDHRSLIALVRRALGDVPAIGMIEAAHFRRWGPHGPSLQDWVSWHTHFVTWGFTRGQLQPFVRAMEIYSSMFGRTAVYIEPIDPEAVAFKMLYASKAQLKTYRVMLKPGEHIDATTGVVTPHTYRTKDWMRTGDHVHMIGVMRDRWLDEMIFGNGWGTQLARAVRYEALKPFCAWAARNNRLAELAGRPIPYPVVNTYRAVGLRLRRDVEHFNV